MNTLETLQRHAVTSFEHTAQFLGEHRNLARGAMLGSIVIAKLAFDTMTTAPLDIPGGAAEGACALYLACAAIDALGTKRLDN